MLKDILNQKSISLYKAAKETGIAYSTLSDVVLEKTAIDSVAAGTVYRLAKYLDVSMESLMETKEKSPSLFVFNEGRMVTVEYGKLRAQYCGPKNLVGFKKLNRVVGNTLYIDTYFLNDGQIFVEEDYIDIADVFTDFDIQINLGTIDNVIIGSPDAKPTEKLFYNSLMISDGMAVAVHNDSTDDVNLEIVNIHRTTDRMLLRLRDYMILSTNMSDRMQKRAIEAVKRNEEIILEETGGKVNYA